MYEDSNGTSEKNFLIVTAAKNEDDMLPVLSRDVVNQSIKPVLWLIADDESSDETWSVIERLRDEYCWIEGIRIRHREEKEYAHPIDPYDKVTRKIFKHAIELCNKRHLNYDLLAVVDADIRLEREYFEKLVKAFHLNPRLGIASGLVYEKETSPEDLEKQKKNPRGAALVFRKECYEAIGGFPGHSESFIKARNRNWQVKAVTSAKIFHRRRVSPLKGTKYFFTLGEYSYFVNYHPISAFLAGVDLLIKNSVSKGLFFLTGYFRSFLLRKEKTDDEELKEYYWNSFDRLLRRFI